MLLLESHFILVDKLYGNAMLIFEQDNESLERDFYLLAACLQTEQSSYPYILTTSCHLSGLGIFYVRRKNHYSHFSYLLCK